MYYVAFDPSNNLILYIWDKTIEVLFAVDLILNFLTEYVDEYNEAPVRELR
jgi:hypothetical protein